MSEDPPAGPVAYGTAAADAPVTRADFERALRALHLSDVETRDALMRLAAQVVALTDELVRRVDGVEPQPAPAGTQAPAPTGTLETAVAKEMPRAVMMVRVGDEQTDGRPALHLSGVDKYKSEGVDIPCAELLHLCKARCCSMHFSLSTQDLDEGVIRWDYGKPYQIRQRDTDKYCVHNHPETRGCTVHEFRPRVCRIYDCREDDRVWIDYEQRIPAPDNTGPTEQKVDLGARVRARQAAFEAEARSVRVGVADPGPVPGPDPATTKRR
jgi:Fe-S-cluster containining protein